MADQEVIIKVQNVDDGVPADENDLTDKTSNLSINADADGSSKSQLPVLRVEELKEDLNSSFSYTSGEEDGHSREASDDPDRKEEEGEFVPPDDELKDKIIQQVEFYFSDANILKDRFLLKHVRRNKQGYVSIKLITSFKKMKSLTKDYRVVAFSLKQSDVLEVNEEGKKVKRKIPLPDYDETTPSRTVVAVNLPMEAPSIENIAELFSNCGEVALIRILKPGKSIPADVKKHSAKHPEIGTSICAVVEFDKHEHAIKAADTMNNKDDWRGLRVFVLAETKKKEKNDKAHDDYADGDAKKKKRGKKNKNKNLDTAVSDHECCSSGSELDSQSRQLHNSSLSPNHNDSHRLSPGSSPRSSPMTSPRSQRRRLGPHGKSPLVETSPNGSPRHSPRSSPEMGRKRYDYSSGGDSTPSSPWVQRRLKAAQELSKSPLTGSPAGSPLLARSKHVFLGMDGVTRQPKGPDGTKGFHFGRGKPRASTFS